MNAAFDWNDLELIGTLAHSGSIHAAARHFGVDDTTIARRLARLEKQLGMAVFERVAGRLKPTPVVQAALPAIMAMREGADAATAALYRRKAELSGQVKVSTVGFIQSGWLAPAMGEFHRNHPKVVLGFVAEDRSVSFERRETDIALRLGRPGDDTARIRKLAAVRFRLYLPVASAFSPGSSLLPTMRYESDLDHLPEMQLLNELLPDAPVIMRSSRLDVLLSASTATGAAVMLPERLGDAASQMMRHPVFDTFAEREIFLMMHPDRIEAPSVRAVADWIVTTFART